MQQPLPTRPVRRVTPADGISPGAAISPVLDAAPLVAPPGAGLGSERNSQKFATPWTTVATALSRPSHRRTFTRKWLRLSALGLVAVLLLALSSSTLGQTMQGTPHSQPTAREVLDRVRAEVVPEDNATTAYGVSFNTEGYDTLLSWHSQYRVTRAQATAFEALDLALPCCAFGHASAEEEKNCGCGHHQALYGLGKRLLGLGSDMAAAQKEVSRWAAYFFPRETLEAALSQRAAGDPAMQAALEELRQKGGC